MQQSCPDGELSFCFNINRKLFNWVTMRNHHSTSTMDLEFADDAVLMCPSRSSAQIAIETFSSVAQSFGLTVNFTKTKFMCCGASLSDLDYQPLVVGQQSVQHTPSFVYLGSLPSPDSRVGPEIDRRLAGAS